MTDTPQQQAILRTNKAAQHVRAMFPAGTRVVSLGGRTGTVERHVPHSNALGGVLRVRWDEPKFGVEVGRVNPTAVKRID